uniref:Uncharacterized protein n=1 Tax=Arundo donax TaxID=35708 RepID=A0A0A8Y883_ARUDO
MDSNPTTKRYRKLFVVVWALSLSRTTCSVVAQL